MTLIASLPVATEALAQALVEALGASEELDFPTAATTEQPDKSWVVDVYFEEAPDETALAALIGTVMSKAVPPYRIEPLPDEDWVAKSLEGLRPVRAGRFLIHGSHDRARVKPNDIAIEIEAGEAFGTGHHGTTAGCLAEIDRLGRLYRFRNILDLGTGTGVLAIAVARAWHQAVIATDIDPVAVRVTRENAVLNHVRWQIEALTAAGFGHAELTRRAPFDLVIANILAGPLIDIAPGMARRLAPRAIVVLSGLLVHQGPRVAAAYRAQGLALRRVRALEGWLTLTLQKIA